MNTAKLIARRLELVALMVMGVAATLIMFFNAVLRYGFDYSIVWGEEAIRILFVSSMFLVITTSFVRNEHVGFDAYMKASRLGRLVCSIGSNLSLVIVGAITAYYGYAYNALVGDTPLPGTDLPTGVFLVPGVIAGAFWVVIGVVRLIRGPVEPAAKVD